MFEEPVDFDGCPQGEQANKNEEKGKEENQDLGIKNNPNSQQYQNYALDAKVPKNTTDRMFYFFQEVDLFHISY